ncbi:hypothetical protein B0H12DRAFT_1123282 [Mycena haematopus]|nr:hypothetical protein B0H12DRAFT_1123282 [Mycena haematopus]
MQPVPPAAWSRLSIFLFPTMHSMYRWMVLLVLLFPISTLAAFIVDDFTKPALTCTPFLLQWQGGIAPWTLRVLQANNSAVLENLGVFKVTSFNWNVDLAAGTSVQIQLEDSSGANATSNTLTIQPGSTDCTLNNAAAQQTTTQQTTQQTTVTSATSSAITSKSTISTTTSSSTSARSFTSSTRTGSASSSTVTQSTATQQSSSSSLAVIPTSTNVLPPSSSTLGETASASNSGTGAFSSVLPEALSTFKASTPIGVILGILIPGLLLLLFFVVFIFRRRRTSSPDIEKLFPSDARNPPAWFMRPAYHSESARVSYGIRSSGSYRTTAGERSLSIAPSGSVSAFSLESTISDDRSSSLNSSR